MKQLIVFLSLLAASLPVFADDKADATKVVDSFYATYIAAIIKGEDEDKLVKQSPQLSPAFKKAYAALVAQAKKEDPELGLDYDPIINGQEYPDAGYATKSLKLEGASGKAVVSSKDKDFDATISLTLVKIEGRWLINGIEDLKGK